MNKKGKRFEFVLDDDLYRSISERAKIENMSVAEVVRNLLVQWDNGEVNLSNTENKGIRLSLPGACKFYIKAPCNSAYQLSLIASEYDLTRVQLLQAVIEAIVKHPSVVGLLLCNHCK